MDQYQKTIRELLERDRELRAALEALRYQHKKKNEFTKKSLQRIRVRLATLKWAIQIFHNNTELSDPENRGELDAIMHAAADALKLAEDLFRTLDDP
ncbi:MAG: hypothetical protein HYS45_00300 [Parcubacteria group bacterium]|nr:hypothetical protein [Parcubacteria group bacterium]